MADRKISQLPDVISLDGTELVPLTQQGVTRRATVSQVQASGLLGQSFITVNTETSLGSERRIVAGSGLQSTDGGAGSTYTLALTDTGIVAGTYTKITFDIKGRATFGENPTTLAGYGITDAQPLDSTLTALAAFNSNGLMTQTAADTFTARSIAPPAAGITVTNGDGVAGNPTLVLANDLAALEGLGSTGLAVRSAADTWVQRSIVQPASGITITDGDGVAGNPTLVLANDLAALEGLGSTGLAARTAADTWAQRSIVQPAAGITVTNGDGVAGNPTLALANDLAALEGLGSTGIAVRSAADTWVQRSVTGSADNGIAITNGDGVAGNITVSAQPAQDFALAMAIALG